MSYKPENQYRCTIIRGKSQSEVEDLLPFYAQTVHKNCPCTKEEFDFRCNKQLSKFFFGNEDYDGLTDANKKTIRNHITEIMERTSLEFSIDVMKKSRYAKDRPNWYSLYYIMK